MLCAKVIGKVVSTNKDESLRGIKLLVIQPINSKQEEIGKAIVAIDTYGAGEGEIVFYSKSKEATFELSNPVVPADAGVAGIVDYITRG